jgi:hypothetical protein
VDEGCGCLEEKTEVDVMKHGCVKMLLRDCSAESNELVIG